MKAPCRDCRERTPECHGVCERYQAYADENRKLREKRYVERQVEVYEVDRKIENRVRKARKDKSMR